MKLYISRETLHISTCKPTSVQHKGVTVLVKSAIMKKANDGLHGHQLIIAPNLFVQLFHLAAVI